MSRYEETFPHVNGMVEEIDFEKNAKQSFLMQYMSYFEISLLIYVVFLHYSSGFIDILYVDISLYDE